MIFQIAVGSNEREIALSRDDLAGDRPVERGMDLVLEKLASQGLALVEEDKRVLQNAVTGLYYGSPPTDPVELRAFKAPSVSRKEDSLPGDLITQLMVHRALWLNYHYSDAIRARSQVEQVACMQRMEVYYWSSVDGLVPQPTGGPGGDTRDPEAALRRILGAEIEEPFLFLFQRLPNDPFAVNNTPVGDLVIELCNLVRSKSSFYLVVLAPQEEVPERWRGLFKVVTLGQEEIGTETIDQIGRDLTLEARDGNLPPLVGRKEELERVMEVLNLAPGVPNSVLLVGPAGTGKTAIVHGLARLIAIGDVPPHLRGRRLIEISVANLVAGTSLRGELEERVRDLLREVRANKERLILFLDEAHALMNAEGREVAQSLKQALSRGDFPLIAATTDGEVAAIKEDAAFARRFTEVRVEEPSVDEAISIVRARCAELEQRHGVGIPPEVVEAAVEDSDWYILDEHLPSKAINLLYDIASRAELKGRRELTLEDIGEAISQRIGVPIASPDEDERARLGGLREALAQRVLFQEEAVKRLASAVIARRISRRRAPRPLAFLFVGPSGVGKTSLAQALAEAHFEGNKAFIRYNMEEYVESFQATKLLGSPPGYVGYPEGSRLIRDIKRHPYSVVLFDEIEKAHRRVILALMGILDSGRYEHRHLVGDFRHAIIIMTSNLLTWSGLEEMGRQELRKQVTTALQGFGVPTEFVGRVEIIPFQDLTVEEIAGVAVKMLDELAEEIRSDFDMEIQIAPNAAKGLVESAFVEGQGVRPVKARLEELRQGLISRITTEIASTPKLVRLIYDCEAKDLQWKKEE